MIEQTATIRNRDGIHCRPSALIIKATIRYAGEIEVIAGAGRTDLRSMLALVALELPQGTVVRIRVTGPDEETFCHELVALFETHFDFPPIGSQQAAVRSHWSLDTGH